MQEKENVAYLPLRSSSATRVRLSCRGTRSACRKQGGGRLFLCQHGFVGERPKWQWAGGGRTQTLVHAAKPVPRRYIAEVARKEIAVRRQSVCDACAAREKDRSVYRPSKKSRLAPETTARQLPV